jgi:hypothetical protein
MSTQNVRSNSLTPVSAAVAQRVFVVMATGALVTTAGAGADVLGVTLEASPANDQKAIPVTCMDGSVQEVVAGAAIDVSAGVVAIMSNASGQAVAATSTNAIVGYAITSAGAAGQVIEFIATKAANVAS